MAKGQLYINGKDAFDEWGIFLDGTALSALMTPPSAKDYISNSFRNRTGKIVVAADKFKFDERDITISIYLSAKTESDFLTKYASFCEELSKGWLVINTIYQPNVYYRCLYVSCSQLSEYMRQLAKFTLKVNEPDPSNRGETNKNE